MGNKDGRLGKTAQFWLNYMDHVWLARSSIPGCRTDVDKTMEETSVQQSKSHGGASGKGLSGIKRNYEA